MDISLNGYPLESDATSLIFGSSNPNNNVQTESGLMDEVRFYSRALSMNEIKAIYDFEK